MTIVASPRDNASTPGYRWAALLGELATHWPVDRWRDLGVVVGCSGGADSVCLVSALASLRNTPANPDAHEARGFLVVAHFNHHLRGADSDADQVLTKELSQQLGLRWAVAQSSERKSDEASMRNQRIRFLIDTAHATGARYIALAHSLDDNVETVLHHLMRGTGPAGLAGIGSPRSIPQDLVLVRPLLDSRRADIRAALKEQNIPWREDISNRDPAYRRNWIRHQLMPLMESQYPQVADAIGRAIEGQRQWREIIDRLAHRWLDEHLTGQAAATESQEEKSRAETGSLALLRRDGELEPAIAVAAAQLLWTRRNWPRREMTQAHWLRLAETLRNQNVERYTLPAGVDVSAAGNVVEISSVLESTSIPRSTR